MVEYSKAIPVGDFHNFEESNYGMQLGFAKHKNSGVLYARIKVTDFIGTVELVVRKNEILHNAILAMSFDDGKEHVDCLLSNKQFVVTPKDDSSALQVFKADNNAINSIALFISRRVREGTSMADYLTSIINLSFRIVWTEDVNGLSFESQIFQPFFAARDDFRGDKMASDEWGQMLDEDPNEFPTENSEGDNIEDFAMSCLSEQTFPDETNRKRKLED